MILVLAATVTAVAAAAAAVAAAKVISVGTPLPLLPPLPPTTAAKIKTKRLVKVEVLNVVVVLQKQNKINCIVKRMTTMVWSVQLVPFFGVPVL